MSDKLDVMESLKEIGVVAVIRADNSADLTDVGDALCAGADQSDRDGTGRPAGIFHSRIDQ